MLAHGLKPRGQAVIKELVHAEQLGGGVVPMGHDQRLHQLACHAAMEHHPLRDGGKAQLPGLQNQDPGRSACRPLTLDGVQKHLLGTLWPKRSQGPSLGPDL